MAREEKAIFTNMCMVTDGNGNVLVLDRLKPDWPGIAFPGGHVERGESFVESVIREVREETGLTVEDPVLCGVKQFQTDSDARYVVFLQSKQIPWDTSFLPRGEGILAAPKRAGKPSPFNRHAGNGSGDGIRWFK